MDNDVYGHLNNVVYYSLFDTVINRYLIGAGGLDIHRGAVVGFAVQSSCTFAGSVAYPDALEGGLRVAKLGSSSVRYEVAIFRAGDPVARAFGDFTHVFVDRATQRPVPLPEPLRAALARLVWPPAAAP
jgi:acyl-CoA thioester hydrolase